VKKPSFQLFVFLYLSDEKFRRKFDQDRVKAVKSLGFKMTRELEETLEKLEMEELRTLATTMGCPRFC